jgi:hypothetical protein
VLTHWVQEVNRDEGKEKGEKRNIHLAFEFKLQEVKDGKWGEFSIDFFFQRFIPF